MIEHWPATGCEQGVALRRASTQGDADEIHPRLESARKLQSVINNFCHFQSFSEIENASAALCWRQVSTFSMALASRK
jgi:hypothetical protein